MINTEVCVSFVIASISVNKTEKSCYLNCLQSFIRRIGLRDVIIDANDGF